MFAEVRGDYPTETAALQSVAEKLDIGSRETLRNWVKQRDDKSAPTSQIMQTEGGQAPAETDTVYDGAGRAVTSVTKNFGKERWKTSATYTGDTVTTTAVAGGQATAVVTNALGQMTQRREYASPQPTGSDFTTTDFTYTPSGQQATVTGPDQAKWSYGYDVFGRQTSSTDPDKGTSTTTFNTLDQAISTTDSRGKTLLSEYDELGRQTGLWDGTKTDASKLAAWTFDTVQKGQGQPATSIRYDGGLNGNAYTTKITAYDPMYHPINSQLTLPATDPLVTAGVPATLAFASLYNVDGTLRQYSNPAVAGLPAETVSNKYNALGLQTTQSGTSAYLSAATYSELGDLRQLTPATTTSQNLQYTYGYEPGTRRLKTTVVSDTVHPGRLLDLTYNQDETGNVTSVFDAATQGTSGATTKTDNQCFTYDGQRRLTEAWTPQTPDCATTGRTTANLDGAAPYWSSYTYTTAGERKTETQHTSTGTTTTNYTYGTTTGQPHPLTQTTGAKAGSYTYNSAGDTTSRPGVQAAQTLAWNTEGQLASATEPAAGTKPATGTSYLYDAAGELLISRNTTADGDTVLYLGGGTEVRLTTKSTTKTLSGTRYYSAAGQTIALRTATAGITGSTRIFLASDPHGTASLTIDALTLAVTKRYTTPFGAPRGTTPTTWPDDKAFLGKPADTITGLTHIGAREYDPTTAQFISVDPILALDQHQSLNGYSYAGNNPTTSSDPTGECMNECGIGVPHGDGSGTVVTDGDVDPDHPGGVHCHNGSCSNHGGGGTAQTSSTGNTSGSGNGSGNGWSHAWSSTTHWLKGASDSVVNYGSSLAHNPEFWQGLGWFVLGGLEGGGGLFLSATGVVECATGVGCLVGVPQFAVGAGLTYGGYLTSAKGSDMLGKAFSEASSDAAGTGGGAASKANKGMGSSKANSRKGSGGASKDPEPTNEVHQAVKEIREGQRPQRLDPDGLPDNFEVRKTTPARIARKWGGAKIYEVNDGNSYRVLVNDYGDVGWIRGHNYDKIYNYAPRD